MNKPELRLNALWAQVTGGIPTIFLKSTDSHFAQP